ncbi:hypothetical protein AnigIFM60653_005334 [Aspergillus niger]|nr:hypothetical protein AnigIFM60653_005334 [Aspergillus niger]GLA35362.1 hypothetical protein AnigIFM63309_010765 [Aspergillus niger]
MNHFCGDCGTPLYGHKVNADGSAGELKIVRAGIFDDEIVNKYKPGHEVYTGRRLPGGKWSRDLATGVKLMGLEAHVTQGPW